MSTAASPPACEASAPLRLVVMGVGGVGKSTVASALAGRFGLAYADADDLHTLADVVKMRFGVPLDDADRSPWLALVGAALRSSGGVVLACSALKRAYRDRIRAEAAADLRFVFLDAAPAEVAVRLRSRTGHLMPATVPDSQFGALERPGPDERDVLTVAAARPVHDIVDDVGRRLAGRPQLGGTGHG